MDGIQGFYRARELSLLFRYISPFSLSVSCVYDYDESMVLGTYTWTESEIAAIRQNEKVQVPLRLVKQKCESVVAVLTLSVGATPGTGGMAQLEGMALEYLDKPGMYKQLPSARR
jgi:hypothetical protein